MSTKPFELNEDDPVLEQFQAGLENWEQPCALPKARQRRVVRTRGKMPVRGTPAPIPLSEEDPIVKQFREGLGDWEHPFESGERDD